MAVPTPASTSATRDTLPPRVNSSEESSPTDDKPKESRKTKKETKGKKNKKEGKNKSKKGSKTKKTKKEDDDGDDEEGETTLNPLGRKKDDDDDSGEPDDDDELSGLDEILDLKDGKKSHKKPAAAKTRPLKRPAAKKHDDADGDEQDTMYYHSCF